MDELDQRLMRELQMDGRAPITSLAKRLSIPRSTVQERLKRLVKTGAIKRFVPVIDHKKLGRPVTAHILATFTPGQQVGQREVARELSRIPGVAEVHLISGEWDILLKVRGASMEEIGTLVIDRIRQIPGIARTMTCTSFYVEKEDTV